MKKIAFLICLLPYFSFAQNFHFSARVGAAGYSGDLKEKNVTLNQLSLIGSVGARFDLTQHITARSYFSYGGLKAADAKRSDSLSVRNLSFQTKLLDFELGVQYNILNLNYHWWTPYVFAGVGLYHYKPYTKDFTGDRVFLQPLSTEGEGFIPGVNNYKLTQFSIPFGLGVDYSLGEDHKIGLEFGYRKLFTDYLDDVSGSYADQATLQTERGDQAVDLAWRTDEINNTPYPPGGTRRGDNKKYDGFYYFAFTYTFRFWFDKYKETSGIPGGRKEKRVGCPSTRAMF